MKKKLFPANRNLNSSFIVLLILSIALMLMDGKVSWIKSFRSSLALVVYPVQFIVDLPTSAATRITAAFESRNHLQSRYKNLVSENKILQQRLIQYESMKAENQRLKELLETSENLEYKTISARILAVDITPFQKQVSINAGSSAGVKTGTPFVDSKGVMGQVIQVYPHYSIGLLISDSNHALPVQVLRNGLRSVAVGSGQTGDLDVLYVTPNSDIKQGDLLVTSGLGLKFPPDYPVAKIHKISHKVGSPFAQISATPLSRLGTSREILLILEDDNFPILTIDSIRQQMENKSK